MMKCLPAILLAAICLLGFETVRAQATIMQAQASALRVHTAMHTSVDAEGRLSLTEQGASYFARLSLDCATKAYPHFSGKKQEKTEDHSSPDKLWPSFYGCFDWHSGVHNHWTLIKLLKNYPNIPEAAAIKQKLEQSFDAKNILQEVSYLQTHQQDGFEFPYGTSWLLKIADELIKWDDPKAKRWLKNLSPLTQYISKKYILIWPMIDTATYSGDHYASSLGLSFALDYARSSKNHKLESVMVATAKNYYEGLKDFPLVKEPFGYDFMSAGLLITDLMRKVYTADEYERWLRLFSPDLFTVDGVKKVLAVQRLDNHNGYASHFDGFHLNRIWCMNGMFKSLSPTALTGDTKAAWIEAESDMWNYAQESIGKGNYDVDHWLSSFSVFALTGYEK
jgi:hypothetical protein